MKITFFLLERGNKDLDVRNALLRLLRTVHKKFCVPMLLELRGLFAKRAANALTELQLRSGPARVEIGKAFSAKVFYLCEKFLKVSDATGEFFNRGSFGPRARRF